MVGSKVLVTGYTGLLGNALCRQLLTCGYSVCGVARNPVKISGVNSYPIDLSEKDAINELVGNLKPSIIFHTAALTNVDLCEEYPNDAKKTNVTATQNIVSAAKITNSLVVYISTDFIFDGNKGNYLENDTPNPANIYGKTKLEGEKLVLGAGIPFIIARTGIFGWNLLPKQSMAEAVINKLKNGLEYTPFIDQYFTPIYTGTLSKLLIKLIKKKVNGIFNIVTDQRISKYDFSKQVAEVFSLDSNLLISKSASTSTFKAPRPVDVSLNNSKLKAVLGIKNINLLDDLLKMKEEAYLYDKN